MKDIENAYVIYLDTGEKAVLDSKIDSSCHFFSKFHAGDCEVQLRLDWNDIDDKGYPTLDADFLFVGTEQRKRLKGERKQAHHTHALEGSGRSYEWVFQNIKRHFRVIVTISVALEERVTLGDSCKAEVIKHT